MNCSISSTVRCVLNVELCVVGVVTNELQSGRINGLLVSKVNVAMPMLILTMLLDNSSRMGWRFREYLMLLGIEYHQPNMNEISHGFKRCKILELNRLCCKDLCFAQDPLELIICAVAQMQVLSLI